MITATKTSALSAFVGCRRLVSLGLTAVSLAVAGCESAHSLKLAPLRTEVERVPGSGARYLVLINDSDWELHHCSYSAFLCDEHDPNPLLRLQAFARCSGCKTVWRPGEEARFQCLDSRLEFPILQPLSRVEVVGHCDEGVFRQAWRITASDEGFRPPGTEAQFSFVPGLQSSTNFASRP